MQTTAVILEGPRALDLGTVSLADPIAGDVVVDIETSAISTGTEKLFWTGEMPPFPGMGYPLVPGYEAVGEVVEAARDTGFKPGDRVFVPGANCFGGVKGLFGGSPKPTRVTGHACHPGCARRSRAAGRRGAAWRWRPRRATRMAGLDKMLPDLIVGHGVVGRLLARLTLAAGGPRPHGLGNRSRRDGRRYGL